MYQEICRIPFIDRPVYGYGLMLVIGFMLGAQLAKYLARRMGYNGDTFINACLLGLVTGVVGARLSHVLESLAANNHEFSNNGKSIGQNLLGMLNVTSGGLTFYGGFLLATPVLIWFAIRKHVPLLRGMDIIAPCLMIGLAFGRIGCYLNGCCYGEECNPAWGVNFPYGSNAFMEQYSKGEIDNVPDAFKDFSTPIPREAAEVGHEVKYKDQLYRLLSKEEVHRKGLDAEAAKLSANSVYPTELYSAFNSFLVAGILVAYFSMRPAAGRVFGLMLILEGASRYLLEMVRVEPPVLGKLSFSMVIGVGLVIAGMLMWWGCGKRRQRPEDGSVGVVVGV